MEGNPEQGDAVMEQIVAALTLTSAGSGVTLPEKSAAAAAAAAAAATTNTADSSVGEDGGEVGPGGLYSPRHRLQSKSRNEVLTYG